MDKIKKMWCNLSLRKSIILYISAFVILAILLNEVFNSFINVMVQIVEKYGKTVLQELDCAA